MKSIQVPRISINAQVPNPIKPGQRLAADGTVYIGPKKKTKKP